MKYAWTIILALLVLFYHQGRHHKTVSHIRCVKGKWVREALFTISSTLLMVGCKVNHIATKNESLGSNVLALDFAKIDSLYFDDTDGMFDTLCFFNYDNIGEIKIVLSTFPYGVDKLDSEPQLGKYRLTFVSRPTEFYNDYKLYNQTRSNIAKKRLDEKYLIAIDSLNCEVVKREYFTPLVVWKNDDWTTDWMRQYAEFIRTPHTFCLNDHKQQQGRIMDLCSHWSLAYIDDDTIPEVILYASMGFIVLTINDGKVIESYGTSYIPKSGLMESDYGDGSMFIDEIFQLKDGVFTRLFDHSDFLIKHDSAGQLETDYYCCSGNDSTIRHVPSLYDFYDCGQYKNQQKSLYEMSIGEKIWFIMIPSKISTHCFNLEWIPALSDGMTMNDYKLTLLVR